MEELIKLDTYPIRGLVGRLLQDKTTRKNILFASDSYAGYGAGYRDDSQMTEGVLLGVDSCDIQPRVYKAAAEQTERTRKRAEVFTPAWIVNQMNNHCDAEWFGRADVFNHQEGQEWTVSTEPVTFPEGKDWKQYVDSRRLEITCGEAPYIVSRYDTSTGEIIPIERRIGILDRKLRIVNENAADEAEWFKWAFRAFQSVYGYEYQGDNLLIARMNLLYTLADYIEAKWHRQATRKELEKFLNVICWNFWQMDGLNDTPPYGIPSDEVVQMSLFDDEEETADEEIVYCKIYDWRADISKLFKGLKKRGKGMKFDYVIGNPPYQEEISTSADNKSLSRQLFPDFIIQSTKVANDSLVLITPSRWFAGDAQDKSFVKLRSFFKENNHISTIVNYPNEKEVFSKNVVIKGGVSYFVYKNCYKGNVSFTTIINGLENTVQRPLFEEGLDIVLSDVIQVSVLSKIKSAASEYLTKITKGRNAFGIIGKESVVESVSEAEPFENSCELRIKGDMIRYIKEAEITKNIEVLNSYKVFISKSAGAPGKDLKIIGKAYLAKPKSACTDSLIPIGCFTSEIEASNLQKYLSTKFLRFMVSILKVSQNVTQIVYRFVPLQDFTSNSDIDWSKPVADIDQQLYKKYGLTPDEIKFIETHVKEME